MANDDFRCGDYLDWDFLKMLLAPAISVTVVYFFLANTQPDMPISTASLISWGVGFVFIICLGWASEKNDDQTSVSGSQPVFSISDIFAALAMSFFALWIPLILEFVWDLIP